MVELQNHPGVIILSRRHKWQQGVVLNQSHRVPKSVINHRRRDIIVLLLMELSAVESYIPRDGVPDE